MSGAAGGGGDDDDFVVKYYAVVVVALVDRLLRTARDEAELAATPEAIAGRSSAATTPSATSASS